MIQKINELSSQGQGALEAVGYLIFGILLLSVWAKTRAAIAVLSVAVVGAFVLVLVVQPEWIVGLFKKDVGA